MEPQDGPNFFPNPSKIITKIELKSKRFFSLFWYDFFTIWGSTFDLKILPKMVKKHVGIDLEPQIQKIKKMTHLLSFLLVFHVPRGAEKTKKSRKKRFQDACKKLSIFLTDFVRFLLDFPPIWNPKISACQKELLNIKLNIYTITFYSRSYKSRLFAHAIQIIITKRMTFPYSPCKFLMREIHLIELY